MKVLIVGAEESVSQAIQAALVQAGIEVEVADINEVEVAISVNGGNIQDVIGNIDMKAHIVDFDNADCSNKGEAAEVNEWNNLEKRMPYVIA